MRRFLRSPYHPYLDAERYDLAEGLVTLAHEAEHLRNPAASENVVECYALQRVRAIAQRQNRKPAYQAELARIAWEVGYPRELAKYRTKRCYDGGPFDLHPGSKLWP